VTRAISFACQRSDAVASRCFSRSGIRVFVDAKGFARGVHTRSLSPHNKLKEALNVPCRSGRSLVDAVTGSSQGVMLDDRSSPASGVAATTA